MAQLFYSSPRARFFDSNGNPLSLGRVSFYFPGTTTLKEVYTDSTGATPATNPHDLDAEGYVRDGGVWLGDGFYDVKLEANNGGAYTTEWTIPNVKGATATPNGAIGDIAFLRVAASIPTLTPGEYGAVYCYGYWNEGDGGQGWFLWDADSSATADSGSVFAPLGTPVTGRWIRVFEGQEVNVAQFGATESAQGAVNSQFENAKAYVKSASAWQQTLHVPKANYLLNTDLTFDGDMTVILEDGAYFTSNALDNVTVSVTCAGAEARGLTPKVDSVTQFTWNPASNSDAYLEWWGTDSAALNRASANGRLLLTGTYTFSDLPSAVDFSQDRVHFAEGTLCTFSLTYIITLNGATFDPNVEDCLIGDYNKVYLSGQVPVKVYSGALASSGAYGNMLESVTHGKTQRGFLKWDKVGNMSIGAQSIDKTYNFSSYVASGTYLTLGAVNPTYIGTVINGPEHIISLNTIAVPLIDNSEIYPQWFGAKPSEAYVSETTTALSKCAASVVTGQNNGILQQINGLGGRFYLETTLTINNLPSAAVELTDIKLIQGASWSGGASNFISIAESSNLNNVVISCTNSVDLGSTVVLRNCNISTGSAVAVSLILKNSTYVADTSASFLEALSSEIGGVLTIASTMNVLSCVVSGELVPTTGGGEWDFNIRNCVFEGGYIKPNGTGTSKNAYIIGNDFRFPVAENPATFLYTPIDDTNFTLTGENVVVGPVTCRTAFNCKVADNTPFINDMAASAPTSGTLLKQTAFSKYNYDFALSSIFVGGGSGSWNILAPFKDTNLIPAKVVTQAIFDGLGTGGVPYAVPHEYFVFVSGTTYRLDIRTENSGDSDGTYFEIDLYPQRSN